MMKILLKILVAPFALALFVLTALFMQEIVTIKVNIDTLLGYTEPGRKQEKER